MKKLITLLILNMFMFFGFSEEEWNIKNGEINGKKFSSAKVINHSGWTIIVNNDFVIFNNGSFRFTYKDLNIKSYASGLKIDYKFPEEGSVEIEVLK